MRSLWKDILTALFMGMVLPGLMLNYAVMGLRRAGPVQEIQITIPEETVAETVLLPVLVRGEDGAVQQEEMDEYLVCVLLAEVPASFEPEALKAQAVAARTYARKAWETGGKHKDGSVCTMSGCCQSYMERETYLQNGGTEDGIAAITRAVAATSGQCLKYEDSLIEATYFSCSGGTTEDALSVWGTDYPYLCSVDSPGEEAAVWHSDQVTFTQEQFCEKLGRAFTGNPETWIETVEYTTGGGVETMTIQGQAYSGTELRSLLGLRSTDFEIQTAEDAIVITTHGYGHRVGMSQYGAEAMAVNGSSYREILSHYYPGTQLVTMIPD